MATYMRKAQSGQWHALKRALDRLHKSFDDVAEDFATCAEVADALRAEMVFAFADHEREEPDLTPLSVEPTDDEVAAMETAINPRAHTSEDDDEVAIATAAAEMAAL